MIGEGGRSIHTVNRVGKEGMGMGARRMQGQGRVMGKSAKGNVCRGYVVINEW